MFDRVKLKIKLLSKAFSEAYNTFRKILLQRNDKTLEDFVSETTFLDNSVRDQDFYFSAYSRPNPITENTDGIHLLIKSVYDQGRQPDEYFWDFCTNFSYLFQTFESHRVEKIGFIENFWEQDPNNAEILSLESSISPIYYFGNKCIGYFLDQGKRKSGLTEDDWEFIKKYRGTRNKIIEHNLHPIGYEFTVRTHFFSASSTDSELAVDLLYYSRKEYDNGFIDYYDDNYKLIDICIRYLKTLVN
jgi:hypothetical protein